MLIHIGSSSSTAHVECLFTLGGRFLPFALNVYPRWVVFIYRSRWMLIHVGWSFSTFRVEYLSRLGRLLLPLGLNVYPYWVILFYSWRWILGHHFLPLTLNVYLNIGLSFSALSTKCLSTLSHDAECLSTLDRLLPPLALKAYPSWVVVLCLSGWILIHVGWSFSTLHAECLSTLGRLLPPLTLNAYPRGSSFSALRVECLFTLNHLFLRLALNVYPHWVSHISLLV